MSTVSSAPRCLPAVRDWLSQAGTAKSVHLYCCIPAGPRDPHMLETPAHLSKRRNGHMSRASRPAIFRDVSATTPCSRVNNAAPANRRPDPVAAAPPVMVIAESVGYASESFFHKALSESVVHRASTANGQRARTINVWKLNRSLAAA